MPNVILAEPSSIGGPSLEDARWFANFAVGMGEVSGAGLMQPSLDPRPFGIEPSSRNIFCAKLMGRKVRTSGLEARLALSEDGVSWGCVGVVVAALRGATAEGEEANERGFSAWDRSSIVSHVPTASICSPLLRSRYG